MVTQSSKNLQVVGSIPAFSTMSNNLNYITMATITIDTDDLNADVDYYENGWFGISIYYKDKLIKKIEK